MSIMDTPHKGVGDVFARAAVEAATTALPYLIDVISKWIAGADPVQSLANKSLAEIMPATFATDLELARQRAAHGMIVRTDPPLRNLLDLPDEPGDGE